MGLGQLSSKKQYINLIALEEMGTGRNPSVWGKSNEKVGRYAGRQFRGFNEYIKFLNGVRESDMIFVISNIIIVCVIFRETNMP